METTPNDLRQQQFDIKMRGYNPDDVEAFRDLAATALEEARAEALKLSEENRHLNQRLKHLIDLEDTLKAAVLEAQRNAERTLQSAKEEATRIVELAKREGDVIANEARQQRERVLSDMNNQMSKLVGDINKIRFIRSNYLRRFRDLIISQMETIEQELGDDNEDNPKPAARQVRPQAHYPEPEPEPKPEPRPETAESSAKVSPRDNSEADESQSENENPDSGNREEESEWQKLKEQFDQD